MYLIIDIRMTGIEYLDSADTYEEAVELLFSWMKIKIAHRLEIREIIATH